MIGLLYNVKNGGYRFGPKSRMQVLGNNSTTPILFPKYLNRKVCLVLFLFYFCSISVFNVFGCLGPELHIGISTQLTIAQEKDYKFFNMVIGITFLDYNQNFDE